MRTRPSQSSSARGADAERLVRRHYRLRGYTVLATNVRGGGGELDIVLRRGRRLVVCEVKARAGSRFGDPLDAVGPDKERRVRRAAEAFLVRHPELAGLELRLEVAAVRPGRIERVRLVS